VTTILTSDPGKAVFQNAAVQIAVYHLPDIRAEKSIFLFKTLLVNLLECFKIIFDTTVVSGILGLALSINIQIGMGGTRMNHLTGKPPA
jgi:hypothetical protein